MTRFYQENSIMRKLATSGVIVLGLMLSGCDDNPNRSVDSVNQPVVQRIDYVLDANTSGNGLAAGEITRIRGWLESLHVAYGDKVSVDTGESGYAGSALNSVGAIVGSYGLLLAPHAPITQGVIAPGAVRIVLSRTKASVPSCTGVESDIVNYNAAVSRDYGCATNASLAAMIANPEDLIVGRESNKTSYRARSAGASGGASSSVSGGSAAGAASASSGFSK
jgi:pilus assembly protein CpaD